jgi:hypothetical protein
MNNFFRFWIHAIAIFNLTTLSAHQTHTMLLDKSTMTILPGLGSWHHPVTTTNEEAQKFFDQGFTLLYAFNHDAAYNSFLKASELDPNLAMAYWGMAYAIGANINMNVTPEHMVKANRLMQQAKKLSANVSPSEKDYIQALSLRYSDDPNADVKAMAKKYSDAMRDLKNKYPDDPDASTLFAESVMDLNPWMLWTIDGQPREGTMEAVGVLESVIKKNPEHIGANHYYIHAVESSQHPEWALKSADRLKTLLPGSGHFLHMPAHIYLLLGDYGAAAETNLKAIEQDKLYIKQFGMGGIYPLHYMSHNLYFLSRAQIMQGRYQDAMNAALELENFYAPHYEEMPELEYYIPAPLYVMFRFHKWNEILALQAPNPNIKMTSVLWLLARAVAYASLGRVDEAKSEQQKYLALEQEIPKDYVWGFNKAEKIFAITNPLLDGKIAEAQNQQDKAIEYLRQAVAAQDELNYNEPPDWFFPVRESLGGLLLKNKQYAEAEQVFRKDLVKHPRNGWALYGLLESLKGQNKTTDVYWVEGEYNQVWSHADVPLTIQSL